MGQEDQPSTSDLQGLTTPELGQSLLSGGRVGWGLTKMSPSPLTTASHWIAL